VRRHGAWRSLVSALVWGTRGPEFESRRPDSERAGLLAERSESLERVAPLGDAEEPDAVHNPGEVSAAAIVDIAAAASGRLLADVQSMDGRAQATRPPVVDRLEAALGREFAEQLVAALSKDALDRLEAALTPEFAERLATALERERSEAA
jgi:hypothetical protein